jgi:hypothetical protein
MIQNTLIILTFIIIAFILLIIMNKENIKNNLLNYHKNSVLNDNSIKNIIEKETIINKNSIKEKSDCNTPKYEVNGNCIMPNYLTEDETNFAKKQLLIFLSKVNKKPIKLKSPCIYKSYTHATMDDLLRRTMDEMSDRVLTLLNKNGTYNFEKANYGNIEVWSDALGNKEYKYELFVTSLKHYFQLKFSIHTIKFIKKSEMKPYGINTSPYIYPTYHNGYPTKDQLIPAPHEVIITGNIVLSTNSMKPNDVEKAEYMYLNHVDVENSTLVINSNIQKNKEFIMDVGQNGGIIDNKLEYTHLSNGKKSNPIQPIAREANKWVETPDKPDYKGQFPCKVTPDRWDEDGVYYYSKVRDNQLKKEERDYESCDGTRYSTEPLPLQPNFWVTNYAEAGTGVNCGPNSWMFSNYEGPMGTFVGGGKR